VFEKKKVVLDQAAQKQAAKRVAEQAKAKRTAAKRQQIAERLGASTGQLSTGVQEASSGIEQILSSLDQIAKGAEESSQTVQETLASVKNIEGAAEKNLSGVEEARGKIVATHTLVGDTVSDIQNLGDGINNVAEVNGNAAKNVADLEAQAKEIGNIVQTVVGVADQTNLLALNAAIEAARAGEHGRGFAVVADEVRKLAAKTESSAGEIRELVQNIQDEVKAVAGDVGKAVKTGNEQVEKPKKFYLI